MLEIGLSDGSTSDAEKIGHVNNLSNSEFSASTLFLEFVLESDEVEKPDIRKKLEKSKSRDWKTVKMLKRIKSLKRYRIVKRLK